MLRRRRNGFFRYRYVAAHHIRVGTAYTVEKIALEPYNEYVVVRFAYNALITLYSVASAVNLDINIAPDQAFHIAFGRIDSNGFFHITIIDKIIANHTAKAVSIKYSYT